MMNDLRDRRVIIVANPKSGASESSDKVSALRDAIVASGFACEIVPDLNAVAALSTQYSERRELRAVVSAGGDGTADALANVLPQHVPLLLFPLGTENLLAKHFKITSDIAAASEAILKGQTFEMDVGRANGTRFLVMASCGFDAEVVGNMSAMRTGHINRLSYFKPIMRAMRDYRFPGLDVTVDKSPDPFKAAWVFVFNVPRYAAYLDFCPQADPMDGRLDVCTFAHGGVARGLGYLLRVLLRSHANMPGFRHQTASRIKIACPQLGNPEARVPFQIDGDPGGELPLSIEVIPSGITLLAPAE